MPTVNQRLYNCKDEELPVICRFAAFSLKRDLADFTAYSPKFNQSYVTAFDMAIASVSEMVMPQTESLTLKTITARMYASMDGLINPINRVTGYLNMAKPDLNISPADFGLTKLRNNANNKNAEGVLNNLRLLNTNLSTYATQLSQQGLTPELSGLFTAAATSIEDDNQQQYEIMSNRKNIVQNNLNLFNSLYVQMMEILNIGKILYKDSDAVKVKEYSFNAMKKKVRIVSNPTPGTPVELPGVPVEGIGLNPVG